jgi:predicted metal-dependent HD superfamily phosphohydrolase
MGATMSYDQLHPYWYLRERLTELLTGFGAKSEKSVQATNNYIFAHYQDPERHYHNMGHIAFCLAQLDEMKDIPGLSLSAKDLRIVELALWFHDLVYNPKRGLNEELSVGLLRFHADEMALPIFVQEACDAILATRYTDPPKTPIDQWVCDIDLGIFHAPEPEFDEYECNVRKEYAFVKDLDWIARRMEVLRDFLKREAIYSLAPYRELYEKAARANLERSLARLARGWIV